ncbi:MAG TPA: class I SAM-dependent methyltransferase [Verrucomicrobiales bacterium]|nr:class I SAM-dependent methyltransferase [Verrucomicrobiales bacterium]
MLFERIRRTLANPALYAAFARLVGGPRSVETLVREHIRPQPGFKVLDIGCGPAEILAHLGEVDYTGFDLSAEYIEAGRARYGSRARLFCQRVTRDVLPHEPCFDLVMAIGVLHHLTDGEARDLFELARGVLKPGGRLVTLDGCYVEGQSRIARFLLSRDRGEYVRTEEAYRQLAQGTFPDPRLRLRHDLLRIPFTHLVMECERRP